MRFQSLGAFATRSMPAARGRLATSAKTRRIPACIIEWVKDILPRRVMDRLWPCYYASSSKLFEICLLSIAIRRLIITVAILAAQWLCGLSRSSRMCSCSVLEISRTLEPFTTAVKISIRVRSLISRHQSARGPKIDLLCLSYKTLLARIKPI
jgi:hypothetical protein